MIMKTICIVVNVLCALIAFKMLWDGITFSEFTGGCIWSINDWRIVEGLLVLVCGMLFKIAWGSGTSAKK